MNKLSVLVTAMLAATNVQASDVLPFPKEANPSVIGDSLADSTYLKTPNQERLAEDAPNIMIIMLDDAGFGHPSTFGGLIDTPAMSELAEGGISYNAFHTTAQCSPSRAALLTGRNHHRVGNGSVPEVGSDFEGYTAEIPKTTATIAEVLGHYGYNTSVFGKWHNTPIQQATEMGPFDRWPTGHGFDYFYGFIGGETSQYEPGLFENTVAIEPPHDPDYHLTDDLAEQAIGWLRNHKALTPDRPFFMYWTPGAVHGPHQVHKKWIEKYEGKFDNGWQAYRDEVFQNQKELGWIPGDAVDHVMPEGMAEWDKLSDREKAYQAKLMEVYAGFLEHTDHNIGKLIDELKAQEELDNTLIFYVFSDNGASAEGGFGTINEMIAINNLNHVYDTKSQMDALDDMYGGLDALGGPKLDSMYAASWAWAGNVPYQYTKLTSSYFGGTRTPMIIHWPDGIEADSTPRSQFHHLNDIVPTIYDVLNITEPKVVDGHEQEPIDGMSLAYTFENADVEAADKTQYFEIFGSRAIYRDGWIASAFGARTPWNPTIQEVINWHPDNDEWELFDLRSDFNQKNNIAAKHPEKLEEMKALFMQEAADNKVLPLGASLLPMLDPSQVPSAGLSEWTLTAGQTRIPEFNAPKVGMVDNNVTIDLELEEGAEGVLFALGNVAGGVAVYIDEDRHLVYEFNQMAVERFVHRSKEPLPLGEGSLLIESRRKDNNWAGALSVDISYNGKSIIETVIPRTTPLIYSFSSTFDVGIDVGSPVSADYFDKAPYALTNAKLHKLYAVHK